MARCHYFEAPTPIVPDVSTDWTEAPAGHWCTADAQTAGQLIFNDICCLEIVYDSTTGTGSFSFETPVQFVDSNGNTQDLNFGTYQQFQAIMGTNPAPGSSGAVMVGGTKVTLTILGPSSDLIIGGTTGALLARPFNTDGLPAGFQLCFDPGVQSVSVYPGGNCPEGIEGIQAVVPRELGGCC